MAEIDVHIVGIGNLGKSFLSGFGSISEGPKLYLYESNEDIVASVSYTHLTLPTKRIV